jgi:hypothetical protein
MMHQHRVYMAMRGILHSLVVARLFGWQKTKSKISQPSRDYCHIEPRVDRSDTRELERGRGLGKSSHVLPIISSVFATGRWRNT